VAARVKVVSPPQRGDEVPALLTSGGPKWRGNFPEGSDHAIVPNRLGRIDHHQRVKELFYGNHDLGSAWWLRTSKKINWKKVKESTTKLGNGQLLSEYDISQN